MLRGGHPLVAAVRQALPRPRLAAPYLALLGRRLAALEAVASGSTKAAEALRERGASPLARRFLRPLEGTWDDGDENLVRGYLDRWVRPGEDPLRAAARGLVEAARAMGRVRARPETLWFLLWEMESILAEMAGEARRRRGAGGCGRGACC